MMASPTCRPRLLFVSRNPPTGSGSGARVRAGLLLHALLQRYEVHLLVIAPELEARDLESPLLRQCASVATDPMHWASRERLQRFGRDSGPLAYLWHALRAEPANVLSLRRSEGEALCARLARHEFDAIVAVRLSMARVAQQLLDWGLIRAPRRAFDLDDIESRVLERGRQLDRHRLGLVVGLGKALEQWRVARCEARLVRRWDQVYVCSDADREALRIAHPGAGVYTVPNTCPPTPPAPPDAVRPLEILFVGSMRYAPNDDAARYFCEQVLPQLRPLLPAEPRVRIVGAGPSAEVRALGRTAGVEIVGTVERIADCYRTAALVVVPIRFGSGTRIKIIEALAAGRPVVSTTLGAEGLGLRDGVEVLLADDPRAFAAACARVLTDATTWWSLVEHGRSCYAARFAPDIVVAAFLKTFSGLLAPHAD